MDFYEPTDDEERETQGPQIIGSASQASARPWLAKGLVIGGLVGVVLSQIGQFLLFRPPPGEIWLRAILPGVALMIFVAVLTAGIVILGLQRWLDSRLDRLHDRVLTNVHNNPGTPPGPDA